MKNEQIAEQAQLAADILRTGCEWEYWNAAPTFGPPVIEWTTSGSAGNPLLAIAAGSTIRLKPKPDPFKELKEAHKAGKVIQWRAGEGWPWHDQSEEGLDWGDKVENYRIKPDPVFVPLEAKDVPPCSVFRSNSWTWKLHSVPEITNSGIVAEIQKGDGRIITWDQLMDPAWQINRSIPFQGKWNPDAWEPCRKEAG